MTSLMFLLFAATALLVHLSSASNFVDTCVDITYDKDRHGPLGKDIRPKLKAKCRTKSGGWNVAEVELMDWIGNDNGQLVWALNGNYKDTCIFCELIKRTLDDSGRQMVVLHCECSRRIKNHWHNPKSEIDLNEKISNLNGYLFAVGVHDQVQSTTRTHSRHMARETGTTSPFVGKILRPVNGDADIN